MKAKEEINHIKVNYGWNKGSKTDKPDYLIRRVRKPLRIEVIDAHQPRNIRQGVSEIILLTILLK